MTDTTVATGLTVQQWDDKFFKEYFQENRFAGEMGTSPMSIIQVKEDLTVKKGQSVTYALINRLTNAGITGSSTLEGNEEDMVTRSFKVNVDKIRNGVRVAEIDEQFSAIGLRDAAKPVLKDWANENSRDSVITALGEINGVAFGSASDAQKDAWLTDNEDRVLFGASKGNTVSGDLSNSMLTIDNTADKLTTASADLLKRLALSASPKIRPVKDPGNGKRFYIMYCGTRNMRDLRADSVITAAQREVSLRMQNSKLFVGGDLEWNGIIFKEIDDIPIIAGVGAGGIDVAGCYLCGAQAVAYAVAKRWTSKTEEFDYGDKVGAAIEEISGYAKMIFGTDVASDTGDTKDHGIATGFFAAVDDA